MKVGVDPHKVKTDGTHADPIKLTDK